ncbi:hypothetical protein [Secundilactobacillus mixtipabuli]|uniref:Uncharacterized protein n=1 Tax=Secundilactobacillus mixtipabuli TaxID=1435342 RepID=A0A1Z5IAK5_9LACO|nr:hypothetical protein [Secundilactobacillus mixtipabuli]GAW98641.1 hypothetical protein IWT30_00600 [Secundilactobacillus mixtipabuli]
MTTIYMHPTKNAEMVNLSDGSEAVVEAVKTAKGQRYLFRFNEHKHANFWCDQPIENGQTVKVTSIDGPEKFKIELR